MPSSHLILCRPLLLLIPIPPSIRVFSNESTLRMRWPKHPKTHINQINKVQTQRTNIKTTRGKRQITHKGIPLRIAADLSIETLQAREWQDILKVMKENNLQPRLLYPARVSFRYEGEIKSFTDKQKLREFSTTKAGLQQMLKDLL